MKTPILMIAIAAGLTVQAIPAAAEGPQRERPAFSEIDADGDGFVTQDEMTAFGEARQAEREAQRAERFAAADTNGDGGLSAEEIVAAENMRRAERMIERFDANDDGLIQADEMGGPSDRAGNRGGDSADRGGRMFDRLDRDDDGQISEEEYENARFGRPHGRPGGHGRPNHN